MKKAAKKLLLKRFKYLLKTFVIRLNSDDKSIIQHIVALDFTISKVSKKKVQAKSEKYLHTHRMKMIIQHKKRYHHQKRLDVYYEIMRLYVSTACSHFQAIVIKM
jgi:hypothetical protein